MVPPYISIAIQYICISVGLIFYGSGCYSTDLTWFAIHLLSQRKVSNYDFVNSARRISKDGHRFLSVEEMVSTQICCPTNNGFGIQ